MVRSNNNIYQNIKINQTIKFIPVSKSKMNQVNKFKIHNFLNY